jgi:hypothetical protein
MLRQHAAGELWEEAGLGTDPADLVRWAMGGGPVAVVRWAVVRTAALASSSGFTDIGRYGTGKVQGALGEPPELTDVGFSGDSETSKDQLL